jgi:hypothetical protein
MSAKADEFMKKAENCDRLAEMAKEPAARKAFTDAAAQWRDLARQADLLAQDPRAPSAD